MQQIKSFLFFLKVIYQQRYIIQKLVVSDFQKRYLGSILGLPWAFIHPAATIMVLWLVVNIGLRGGDIGGGLSFLPWFVCGIVPWFL
jgi:lipopolysaccharide transport system permease protein